MRCSVVGTDRLVSSRPEGDLLPDSLVQKAYTAVLSHLIEHQRAPHYTELADQLGVSIEDARVTLRETAVAAPAGACWLSHDTDYVEAWGPFSNVPTHVNISIGDQDGWFGL